MRRKGEDGTERPAALSAHSMSMTRAVSTSPLTRSHGFRLGLDSASASVASAAGSAAVRSSERSTSEGGAAISSALVPASAIPSLYSGSCGSRVRPARTPAAPPRCLRPSGQQRSYGAQPLAPAAAVQQHDQREHAWPAHSAEQGEVGERPVQAPPAHHERARPAQLEQPLVAVHAAVPAPAGPAERQSGDEA